MLSKVCDFYNMKLSEFFLDKGIYIELPIEQRKLLELTEKMDKEQIEHLNEFIKMFSKENKK